MIRTSHAEWPARDMQRGVHELSAEKSPAAFDENLRHSTALRRRVVERGVTVAGSYFARKSSTASFRKSGKALRSVSWSQSHHASSASRLATASGNRRLIARAGFPATMV